MLDTVKMLACMLGCCNIGLQWSINGVLIETFPSCSGIESRSGCGSKLGDETRLMTMKGGTVLNTVKMLTCMLGGCNIGLQWSINGVLIETFPFCSGIENRRGCGLHTRGSDSVDDNERWNCVGYCKNACMHVV